MLQKKDAIFYAVINKNYPAIELIKTKQKGGLIITPPEIERLIHQMQDETLLKYL